MNLFNPLSIEDHHFLLASHLPSGAIWNDAFNPYTDFGKLFLALAVEFYRYQVLEKKIFDEMSITKTDELLVNWERSIGLPDKYFSTKNVNHDLRRKQIYMKFSQFGGVQTKEDFYRVANFFNFDVTINTGKELCVFPIPFPLHFIKDLKTAVHTFFVRINDNRNQINFFPLKFPIPFTEDGKTFLKRIFDFLSPANVQTFFQ